jgi:ribosome maturation protein Sdo1
MIQDPRRRIINTTTRRSITEVLTTELMPYMISRKPQELRINISFHKKGLNGHEQYSSIP